VIGRYARTHAPFSETDTAAELGLPDAVVVEVLRRLEAEGRVASGAYRPGGRGREWVDVDVLRRLRRRSLAALRSEVEAVEPAAFAAFLPSWLDIDRGRTGPDGLSEAVRRLRGAAIPASILERDVLDLRIRRGSGRIDDLLVGGDIVWIGRGPLGARDGKIALYPRSQVPLLLWARDQDLPDGAYHEAIRGHLHARGASFFTDLYAACGGGDPTGTLDALWDLVWSGEITNDTLAPLRAFVASRPRRPVRSRPSLSVSTPPSASGRWYLVSDLLTTPAGIEEAATARAEMLLDRYGVVTRAGVLAEGLPGGFAGLYPVLSAMEDAGRVRRGYFVEGLGGAQFGLPGAIGRVRSERPDLPTLLAAADPANAYGASIPWPEHPAAKPARRSGAYVVLSRGEVVVFSERGGKRALAFSTDTGSVAAGLATVAMHRGDMTVETIDGEPVAGSLWERDLAEAGFRSGYRGFTLRT
jgi:ATP-dependent Lhr-like helicase